jgi:hypothetical protein
LDRANVIEFRITDEITDYLENPVPKLEKFKKVRCVNGRKFR